MNIRHFLLCAVLFVALLTSVGCANAESGGAVILPDSFRCEVAGVIGETEVTAVIEKSGESIVVSYLSPATLEGIRAEKTDGTWRVTSGEVVITDERTAAALLSPALLLTADHGTPETVQMEENGCTTRRYADGVSVTVTGDGTPVEYRHEGSEWRVTWMEKGGQS